jgi:signal transduction histidine kinase
VPDGKAISTSPPGGPASHPLPAPFAYGAAFAGVALCTLLRWPLQPLIGDSNSYTLFYPAILVVSWFGGLGAGIAATLLSALAADLFFLSPRIGLTAPDRPAAINLLLFLVVGASLARITTGWRRAEALRRTEMGRRQREQELHRLGNEQLYREAHEAHAAAEAASRSKDEFLATISHELRTPLNAMMGWAQLLQMNRDEQRTATGLETILRNARLQAQLIDDLLDLSRIVSGKMRLDVRALDLTKAIEGAVEAVRPAAEAKAIRLVQCLDPRAGPVAGDPDRLQQVVWNLLSNAVKFTPSNGRVEIRLERVNSHLEIMVADNGAGISAEALPFVFERFWQASGATTRTHRGLGLGLAIVRHLVELHGGTVAVSSPGDGQGTTFLVRLPQSG